jgi:hypothetical protein
MEKNMEREFITLLKVQDMKAIISRDIVKDKELSITETDRLHTQDL